MAEFKNTDSKDVSIKKIKKKKIILLIIILPKTKNQILKLFS